MRVVASAALLVVCSLVVSLSPQQCAAMTIPFAYWKVDPENSSLEVSGSVAGSDLVEQSPGSLLSTFGGMIGVRLESDTIQFVRGRGADAEITGMYEPGPRDGDYGLRANFAFGATFMGVVYDAVLTPSSEPIFVSKGGFDPSLVTLEITRGNIDFDAPGNVGSASLAGATAVNASTDPGTLTVDGSLATLTLPIEFNLADEETGFFVDLTGTFVATRIIPEPGCVALLVSGALLAMLARRRITPPSGP